MREIRKAPLTGDERVDTAIVIASCFHDDVCLASRERRVREITREIRTTPLTGDGCTDKAIVVASAAWTTIITLFLFGYAPRSVDWVKSYIKTGYASPIFMDYMYGLALLSISAAFPWVMSIMVWATPHRYSGVKAGLLLLWLAIWAPLAAYLFFWMFVEMLWWNMQLDY